MKPAISVIIPVHNAAPYLEECVGSVLKQSFEDFEVILVDDCSTDGSSAVCDDLVKVDERLKVLHLDRNEGTGPARNKGLETAQGKYIAFLDDDDAYLQDILENLFQAAEKYQADVVSTIGFDNWEKDKITRRIWGITAENDLQLPIDMRARMELWKEEKLSWVIWNKLFSHAFLKDKGIDFKPIPIADDKFFHFQCVCEAEVYVQIPVVGNLYRIHPSVSQFHEDDEKFLNKAMRAMRLEQEALTDYMSSHELFVKDKHLWEQVRQVYTRTSLDFFRLQLGCTGAEFQGDSRLSLAIDHAWQGEKNGWLACYFFKQAEYWRSKALNGKDEEHRRYLFPYHLFRPGMKVVLYGAGEVGVSFYDQLQNHHYVTLAGVVDGRGGEGHFPMPVEPIGALKNMDYDAVLIAVRFRHLAREIKNNLENMGVEEKCIYWDGDNYEEEDFLRNHYFPKLEGLK